LNLSPSYKSYENPGSDILIVWDAFLRNAKNVCGTFFYRAMHS